MMKKMFVAVFALVFVFFAGCSSSNEKTEVVSEAEIVNAAAAVTLSQAETDTTADKEADEPAQPEETKAEKEEPVADEADVKPAVDVSENEAVKPAASKEAVEAESGNDEVKWVQFNAGLATAQSQKKHMIVDFYTDWCHWCKVMDEKTFSDKAVSNKLSQRFVTVRLNAEAQDKMLTYKGQDFSNAQFTKAVQVSGFPSLGFFDTAGELITIIPGYIPPESFIHILGYIDGEYYKKDVAFEDYLKQQES